MKQDDKQFEADGVVRAEACAWIAQLEAGDMSRADRKQLRQWIARSPSHEAIIKEYAQLWSGLDALGLIQPAYEQVRDERRTTYKYVSNASWLQPRIFVGMATSILFLVTLSGWFLYSSIQSKTEDVTVATAIGQARSIDMSDGSVINVNTASNMQVNYSPRERSVRLTHGEAVFRVASDEQRPFVVHAGQHIVRAIGTEFSVRLVDEEVEVVVTEGRVEIEQAALGTSGDIVGDTIATTYSEEENPSITNAVLVRGQKARATAQGVRVVEAVNLSHVEQRLSWRKGVLDFSGETLSYAVGEVERYTSYEIEIADASLANRRIGGVFRLSDVGQFIDVLEESFDIEAERIGDRRVVLRLASGQ